MKAERAVFSDGMCVATIRSELASAYFLTASRVGAWACVSAMVMRVPWGGPYQFGALSTLRGVATGLMFLGYASTPVVLRLMAKASVPLAESGASARGRAPALEYERHGWPKGLHSRDVLATSTTAISIGLLLGVVVLTPMGGKIDQKLWLLMALGMALRALSELSGVAIQSRGKLWVDNLITGVGEWSWPLVLGVLLASRNRNGDWAAGLSFCASGALILTFRRSTLRTWGDAFAGGRRWDWRVVTAMGSAGWVLLSLAGDFCYGAMNQVLISDIAGERLATLYAPALQVDAGMLTLTAAISGVVMPRMTNALAGGQTDVARALYTRSVIGSLVLLGSAALMLGIFANPILRLWLGNGVQPEAAAVLRLVLIHTVIGGSSGVGRAVLLAAGRYRVFALVAVGFGVANAAGVWWVLSGTSWGVRGVVVVTIVTVALRCGVWMPWYVMRVLGAGVGVPVMRAGAEPLPVPDAGVQT